MVSNDIPRIFLSANAMECSRLILGDRVRNCFPEGRKRRGMRAQFVRTNTIFLTAQTSLEMRSRRENVDVVSEQVAGVAVFF
jgi:hypothetical protein